MYERFKGNDERGEIKERERESNMVVVCLFVRWGERKGVETVNVHLRKEVESLFICFSE